MKAPDWFPQWPPRPFSDDWFYLSWLLVGGAALGGVFVTILGAIIY
jgi:hypothetical protein